MEKLESKKVYLITTKDATVPILRKALECIDILEEDEKIGSVFWSFLLKEGSLVHAVYPFLKPDTETAQVLEKGKKDWMIEGRSNPHATFDKFEKGQIPASVFFEQTMYDAEYSKELLFEDVINSLDTIHEKMTKQRLLRSFSRISQDNIDILITHNWYNSGIYPLKLTNSLLKFEFVEILICLVYSIYRGENIDLHLVLHDEDLFELGKYDCIVESSDFIPNENGEFANITSLIEERKILVFQHSVQNFFYFDYLNNANLDEFDYVKEINKFFLPRVPPEIKIEYCTDSKIEYIEFTLGDDPKLLYCSDREIIEAIANFQEVSKEDDDSEKIFQLNYVDKSRHDFENVVKKMRPRMPIVVRSNSLYGRVLKEQASTRPTDLRFNYFDSSIWLQCICDNQKPVFPTMVNIYTSDNAIESRDFNARMCLQSYVRRSDNGHYRGLVPFYFHSENFMRIQADEVLKQLKDDFQLSKHQKRRILLIDDNIREKKEAIIQGGKVDKFDIIASVLSQDFQIISPHGNYDDNADFDKPLLIFEFAKTISQAKSKLEEKRFDCILLDFLLDFKDSRNKNLGREYGTEFLDQLRKDCEVGDGSEKSGPFGKYWIFLITAFTTALNEKMLSETLHYNTNYWLISRGARPTTTPQLFRYTFYSFLARQFKEISCASSSTKTEENQGRISILDLLNIIFASTSVRNEAIGQFSNFLQLRVRYQKLDKDYYFENGSTPLERKENGSLLVQSLFTDIQYCNGFFWDNLQHLVYTIAFGNIRQWNEMWYTYKAVEKKLLMMEKENPTSIAKSRKSICEMIEGYIFDIKKNNF